MQNDIYKIIKDIYSNQELLDKNQKEFWKEVFNQYPTIFKVDLKEETKKLISELETLLSMSVKYKTGRIEVPAMIDSYYREIKQVFILDREPGLREFNSRYADFCFFQRNNWVENDNIYARVHKKQKGNQFTSDEEETILKCELSFLRSLNEQNSKHATIDGTKLEIFFKFLREVDAFKKKIYSWCNLDLSKQNSYSPGTTKNKDVIKVGDFKIIIDSKGLTLSLENKLNYNEEEFWRIVDYKGNYSYSHSFTKDKFEEINLEFHYRLKSLMDSWPEFKTMLDKLEEEKLAFVKTIRKFVADMEAYTVPYKVLNKLRN
jgi:hypothetical protein